MPRAAWKLVAFALINLQLARSLAGCLVFIQVPIVRGYLPVCWRSVLVAATSQVTSIGGHLANGLDRTTPWTIPAAH